jgi:PAS domain S-box-containing protein
MNPSHDPTTPPHLSSLDNGQKPQEPTPDLKQKPGEPQALSDLEPRADPSEERFREVLESVHAIVWEADAATLRPIFVSQGVERILGFSPGQWLQTPNFWADHLHPEERERSLRCERETLEKGGPLWVEYRMKKAGGGFRWFRDSMYLVKGPEGKARLLRGIMVDITESKEAGEALRQSEQRYRDFISQSSEGVWCLELEPPVPLDLPEEEILERFLQNAYMAECNLALARIIGASDPGEVMGRRLRDVIPSQDEGRMESFRSAARGRFQSRTIEFRALDMAGNSKVLLRTEIPIIENGLLVRIWGITRDITERKQAEQALLRSEGRYRTLFENAPVGIYHTDPEGRILAANPVIVQMLGFSSFEELAARNLNLEGFDPGHPRAQFRELVEGQRGVVELESAWRRRDGSIVHVRENARAFRDDSGRVLYYEGTVEDITSQKEAEHRQDLAVRVLDVLNHASSLSGMLGEILRVIRKQTGFDAVGIRLREGEDFPYFVQEGFSEEFARKENDLCARNPEGALERDERGHAMLECACGMVLGGRTDPANPWFTPGGSFWTNASSRLSGLARARDDQGNRLNRCIYEGYESLALIPIRVGQEVAGLLQLNDRRRDRFIPDTIAFFESIGASIGLGLARWREEEALRQSEQLNREVIYNAQEGVIVYDREFRYRVWNRFMEELTGMPAAQVLGKNALVLFPHLREQNVEPLLRRALAGETVHSDDVPYRVPGTGKSGWVSGTYSPHFSADGEIVGVVGIVHEISKRKKGEAALQSSLEQLRALAGRLQSIREEERKRAAREIHDQLGQALTAIKLELSSFVRELGYDPYQPPLRASSILKLVDETIHAVRRISTELRPAILDDLGLVATVEWVGEEFEARTGTRCRLDLPQEDIAIDPERASAIFRILQETLTNVTRHADASEVHVRLAKEDGDLTLEVHDNGKGIPEDKLSNGKSLGILGMRERALLLGGDLMITGVPGEGTTVRVRIPGGPPPGTGNHDD